VFTSAATGVLMDMNCQLRVIVGSELVAYLKIVCLCLDFQQTVANSWIVLQEKEAVHMFINCTVVSNTLFMLRSHNEGLCPALPNPLIIRRAFYVCYCLSQLGQIHNVQVASLLRCLQNSLYTVFQNE
jgi:hypothetical protein